MADNEILLIHLGGLGDVCLSESVFFSLRQHFGNTIVAVGTKRFFHLFPEYFLRIHGVESRHWLYLFSAQPTDIRWKRIVFIGKDREGELRRRWQEISLNPMIFIDMYPDKEFGVRSSEFGEKIDEANQVVHIEEHQLRQLAQYGIAPVKKEIPLKESSRVILYPEKGFEKTKWELENFTALYRSLKSRGVDVHIMESPDLKLEIPAKISITGLDEVKDYFQKEGSVFVSNDSGMAHLAGACGLFTITVFMGYDPCVWHPRGANISLIHDRDHIDAVSLENIILDTLASPCRPGITDGREDHL